MTIRSKQQQLPPYSAVILSKRCQRDFNDLGARDMKAILTTSTSTDVDYHRSKSRHDQQGYPAKAKYESSSRLTAITHRMVFGTHQGDPHLLSPPKNPQRRQGCSLACKRRQGQSSHDLGSLRMRCILQRHCIVPNTQELIGTPRADLPRHSHVAWDPTNPNKLVSADNDDHSVFILDIHSIVKSLRIDSPAMTEAQIRHTLL
ncbi:MAG: hypothetical protein J3Q66DRAFT_423290 [Benniella sp.]|nr:MAG: hypothetical protein J3Q66DRAFT_423290 [Benniella sp.]